MKFRNHYRVMAIHLFDDKPQNMLKQAAEEVFLATDSGKEFMSIVGGSDGIVLYFASGEFDSVDIVDREDNTANEIKGWIRDYMQSTMTRLAVAEEPDIPIDLLARAYDIISRTE